MGSLFQSSTQSEKEKSDTQPKRTGPKEYTLEEIQKKQGPLCTWIIIDDKVYNVSNYMSSHPGGLLKILDHKAPNDATEAFRNQGHSK